MEVSLPVKPRLFRSKSAILALLTEQQQSGLSIQAYCQAHSIPSASFHNWKKKYSTSSDRSAEQAFTRLQLSAVTPQPLFAEVKGIKLYQPVSAGYLKELLA